MNEVSVEKKIESVGELIDGLNEMIESGMCTRETPIIGYHADDDFDVDILNLEMDDGKVIVNLINPIIFSDEDNNEPPFDEE